MRIFRPFFPFASPNQITFPSPKKVPLDKNPKGVYAILREENRKEQLTHKHNLDR